MKFIRSLWISGAIIYSLIFIVCCFSRFIAPSNFQYISFAALTFPVLFAGQVFITFISFFVQRRTAMLCLIALCFSFFNIRTSVSFHKKHFDLKKADSSIRILTWNVQYFQFNRDSASAIQKRMIDVIKHYDADILCLQDYESLRQHDAQSTLSALGYIYITNTDSTDSNYSGVAILSKHKMTSIQSHIIDSSTQEKAASAAIIINNDTIELNSIHLRSYALFADTSGTHSRLGNYKIGYERKRFFVKRIRDVEKIHEQQVKLIRNYTDSSQYPFIICGDLNAVPASYTYSTLSKGLKDAHTEKGYFLGGTYFHLFPSLRIDVCLTHPQFRILQTTVDQNRLSDHKAVITDVHLNR